MTDTATAAAPEISNDKASLTDSIKTAFSGDAPLTEKLKSFYKARPAAALVLGAVAGLAILNTLRGKQ